MPIPAGSTVRYVTPQQVREVLSPDGADTTGSSGAGMDDAALETAIVEAADEVDAKLAARYTVPFDTAGSVPSSIITLTRDIAAYRAWLTFRRGDPVPPGDPVAVRYQMAEQWLSALSSGSAELPAGAGVTTETGQVAVANPYDGNLFSPDDFGVSQSPVPASPGSFPSTGPWGPGGW